MYAGASDRKVSIPEGAIEGMYARNGVVRSIEFQYPKVRLKVLLEYYHQALSLGFNTRRCD